MYHTEESLDSPHLAAEQNRLLDCIIFIRSCGVVAPAYCWLVESIETKGNRSYTYARLVTHASGKKLKSKRLGKPGSEQHRYWEGAIARREGIVELEQQLKMLETLIIRQDESAQVIAHAQRILPL
ncbi:MAG TPA: hypothetical protein V6C84_08665 [Coleofasciculaceae cyanobacterium]|jgi:hypothetical protein